MMAERRVVIVREFDQLSENPQRQCIQAGSEVGPLAAERIIRTLEREGL